MPVGIYPHKKMHLNTRKALLKANFGRKCSKETREKIGLANSISQKGKKHSEEQNKKQSERMKGKKLYVITDEIKKKISDALKGRKLPEETKRKMSKSLKGRNTWSRGRKHTKETKRKISDSNKGKKMSIDACNKISIAHKGKHQYWNRGEKNSNWKGGITPENHKIRSSIEYRLWRESVFARDNWICKKCEYNKGNILHPHHILNFAQYPELRFAIDNGITFCRECHRKFHKRYGTKNNTREQLQEFLSL